ncbi:hypothetical protein ACIGZI_35405 [Streptomyces griseus]|uniref:hypothetical protein n=1 Tax=Streptomyces griseus TaxID=1911 RepID=UPI0037D7DBC6
MLARRKAALERAAERMAGQRREAEEAEALRRRQEAAFDELVADFELAVQDETAAAAEVEEEVARVRERGQVRIDAARVAAARVVLAMGEAGETVAGCGQRLGVGVERVKELRRLGREGLAAEGAVVEKGRTGASGRTAAAVKTVGSRQGTAGGPGGEQQLDGGRGSGQGDAVSRGAGAGRVTAPPVTAPAAPPAPAAAPVRSAPSGVPSAGTPAGPSRGPGSGGGARGVWPESAR